MILSPVVRSYLPLFCGILWAKSSNFNKKPHFRVPHENEKFLHADSPHVQFDNVNILKKC